MMLLFLFLCLLLFALLFIDALLIAVVVVEVGKKNLTPRWLLYYSASSVFRRKDSKSPPSLYIGIAAAPAVEGPYQRLNEKPFFGTSEGVPQVIGTFAANEEGEIYSKAAPTTSFSMSFPDSMLTR